MDSFSSLFKKDKIGQLVLCIVFIIYLIMGYDIPAPVSKLVDSLIGKLIIMGLVVYMFIHTNPILAVLALFVGFDLIRRSEKTTDTHTVMKYAPSEKKKSGQLNAYNQFPYTLEQEVVQQMAPIVISGAPIKKASYKPMMENLYNASAVNKMN